MLNKIFLNEKIAFDYRFKLNIYFLKINGWFIVLLMMVSIYI